jgi:hypothetical protein
MSSDLVTFNVRCEKQMYEMKIQTPIKISGFIKELKTILEVEDIDELVILCPTSDGKMMEIISDYDIEFLKKTKLCYNAVSKEIYCSVELVVIIVHKYSPDDPKVQLMTLSNKFDKLASQFNELSESLNTKIETSTSNIIKNISSFMLECSQTDSNSTFKKNSSDEDNNYEPKVVNQRKNIIKKNKEKHSTSSSYNLIDNDKSSNIPENFNQLNIKSNSTNKSKNVDDPLDKLVKLGFTNTIQNIVVLKRFDNDVDKAIKYLRDTN